MENGDTTAEYLEMAALITGNYTHAADDINRCVGQWQLLNNCAMFLNSHHGIFWQQIWPPCGAIFAVISKDLFIDMLREQ